MNYFKTILFLILYFITQNIYAAACTAEPSTDAADCWAVPDYYAITLYEMGVCNGINDQLPAVPDIDTLCQTTYSNPNGVLIEIQNNVSSTITGGTNTKPANGTYAYGYIKVDATFLMKTIHTFNGAQVGSNGGNGTSCWTSGDKSTTGTTTTCGNAGAEAPVNMEALVVALGAPPFAFYNRYEGDAEGLDDTYAWLIDADGNASVISDYSGDAGDVKYLIGVAKYGTAKTVTDATKTMEAQFRVTRGLNVGFNGDGDVNFGINEFKVFTDIY